MQVNWRGVFPAITTQFRDDQSLNLEGTARHLEIMIKAGIHGVVLLGTVGENTALAYEEKLEVLREMKRAAAGRIPVLTGVAEYRYSSWHLPAMAVSIAAVAVYSMRTRRFLYMLYAILYGYACLSLVALDFFHGTAAMYIYGIVSSLTVIGLIFILSRRFKEGA